MLKAELQDLAKTLHELKGVYRMFENPFVTVISRKDKIPFEHKVDKNNSFFYPEELDEIQRHNLTTWGKEVEGRRSEPYDLSNCHFWQYIKSHEPVTVLSGHLYEGNIGVSFLVRITSKFDRYILVFSFVGERTGYYDRVAIESIILSMLKDALGAQDVH